ncbi:MAG TPA: nucleoside-diphosphate sugar epimerase/dehydratase [Acidimicrobiia bacterium]|jgi:FlaA1/EpsC-like NDP-sugar epimerase
MTEQQPRAGHGHAAASGRSRIGDWALEHRYALIPLVDVLLWVVVMPAAAFARLEFLPGGIDWPPIGLAVVGAVVIHVVAGYAVGIYGRRRKLGSFDEVAWVAFTTGVVVLTLIVAVWLIPGDFLVPRSTILAAGAYELVGALAFRYLVRLLVEQRRRSPHVRSQRVIVFGAGEAGEEVVRALREDPESDLLPMAYLDDDRTKHRMRLMGLRVEGGRDAIAAAAARHDAGVLLIAMPSATHAAALEIADIGRGAGLSVRILPRLGKFLTEPVAVKDIRHVTLSDFLSRAEIALDLDQIASYLTGKRVLVTGAGGSIGSELCATVRRFEPAELLMLDHAENSLHALQLSLEGRALLDSPDLLLADIRDRDTIEALFTDVRPDVVFHAAAHKHVTFLERHPFEAVKTNVTGTRNILEAARAAGVTRFVNISTDKAADPTSVLGLTKRVAERLTAHYGDGGAGIYMSVRFGNVLGSAGSVIPTFREQIANGEPITVTHPDVTRYFMTIPEAVQLVVQAGAIGSAGDVMVLDMGEPVRIVELANLLAAEVSPGIPPSIEYTGLRNGEKLHEILFSADDEKLDQPHELLWRYRVPPLDPSELSALGTARSGDDVVEALRRIVASGIDAHTPGMMS